MAMKTNLKAVMKAAWELARAAAVNFGGKAREFFAASLKMAWTEVKKGAVKMKGTATLTNGNKDVTLSIVGESEWVAGANKRVYFDLECTGKRQPVGKLYEVISGTTRDEIINVNGKTYAFAFGVDANSNTKRSAIHAALFEILGA